MLQRFENSLLSEKILTYGGIVHLSYIGIWCRYIMTNITMWKCYRCDLTFKEKAHAEFHKDLENHNSQKLMFSMA